MTRAEAGEVVDVGGALPGACQWIDDHIARVQCSGHDDAIAVYSAACHDGADLDGVEAVSIGGSTYIVGPRGCLEAAGYVDDCAAASHADAEPAGATSRADDLIALSVLEDRTVAEYPDSIADAADLIERLAVLADDDCTIEHHSGAGASGSEAVGYYPIWGTDDDGATWCVHVVTAEVRSSRRGCR